MTKRRVVVTGMGIISPLGNSVHDAWANLVDGKSGIDTITDFDTSDLATTFAGLVTDFTFLDWVDDAKLQKKVDKYIQYGIAAANQALIDSGLDEQKKSTAGVIIGSGIGGLPYIEKTCSTIIKGSVRKVSPFFVPGSIINMVSGYISILHNMRGPNVAVATACTSGTHCIGLGARMITSCDADVMVVGGSESPVCRLGISGFNAARALSTRNDNPKEASRPWDKNRDGFVLGEGAGILILEEYEHARKRNANIYAEVKGFGMNADAYHITLPSSNGEGASACMTRALADAQLNPEDIQYINAHGTSTLGGDIAETQAVHSTFGAHANKLAVSSSKSMTGHLLGAAGAVEAVFSVNALQQQVVPPTINLHEPDDGCDLDYVPNHSRDMNLRNVLSNSFGFGGTNGTLIFGTV